MSRDTKDRDVPPRKPKEDESTREPSKGKPAVDAELDKELEDSFPASDPPSLTQDPH